MPIDLDAAGPVLDRLRPRVLFSDVDGTLVGKGASLLADLDGNPTLAAAEALVAAHTAGLGVVLVSGRTQAQLFESGRLIGLRDAIAELGTVLVMDGKAELLWGHAPREWATPTEGLRRSGAQDLLLEAFAGTLEFHTPWHTEDRQGTILLRGLVDVDEAARLLADAGLPWARLIDNGRLRRAFPDLGLAAGAARAYHLLPAGVSKGSTAARYLERRGLNPANAAAIGDSIADLELGTAVGAMFLVGNAAADTVAAAAPEVVLTPRAAGEGWADAVHALLARTS